MAVEPVDVELLPRVHARGPLALRRHAWSRAPSPSTSPHTQVYVLFSVLASVLLASLLAEPLAAPAGAFAARARPAPRVRRRRGAVRRGVRAHDAGPGHEPAPRRGAIPAVLRALALAPRAHGRRGLRRRVRAPIVKARFTERGDLTLGRFRVSALVPLRLASGPPLESAPVRLRVVPRPANVLRLGMALATRHQPGGVAARVEDRRVDGSARRAPVSKGRPHPRPVGAHVGAHREARRTRVPGGVLHARGRGARLRRAPQARSRGARHVRGGRLAHRRRGRAPRPRRCARRPPRDRRADPRPDARSQPGLPRASPRSPGGGRGRARTSIATGSSSSSRRTWLACPPSC